jgi:hypothetical protein
MPAMDTNTGNDHVDVSVPPNPTDGEVQLRTLRDAVHRSQNRG